MRAKAQIESILDDLQVLYDGSTNTLHKTFYSKLALLELCGWLEETMDDIVLSYAQPKIPNTSDRNVLKDIIDKIHGCSYNHTRNMLIKVIGIANVPQLEINLTSLGSLTIIKSQLNSLWSSRITAAHTTVAGTTPAYDSPARVKLYLDALYPELSKMELELSKL